MSGSRFLGITQSQALAVSLLDRSVNVAVLCLLFGVGSIYVNKKLKTKNEVYLTPLRMTDAERGRWGEGGEGFGAASPRPRVLGSGDVPAPNTSNFLKSQKRDHSSSIFRGPKEGCKPFPSLIKIGMLSFDNVSAK